MWFIPPGLAREGLIFAAQCVEVYTPGHQIVTEGIAGYVSNVSGGFQVPVHLADDVALRLQKWHILFRAPHFRRDSFDYRSVPFDITYTMILPSQIIFTSRMGKQVTRRHEGAHLEYCQFYGLK